MAYKKKYKHQPMLLGKLKLMYKNAKFLENRNNVYIWKCEIIENAS